MDGELVHDNPFISSPVMQVQLKDFLSFRFILVLIKTSSKKILIKTDGNDKERVYVTVVIQQVSILQNFQSY